MIWGALAVTGSRTAEPGPVVSTSPAPEPTTPQASPQKGKTTPPPPAPPNVTMDPTPDVAPPLVRSHFPSKAKLTNSTVRLGLFEARTFSDFEVNRDNPTRTVLSSPLIAVLYSWDPVSADTAAAECLLSRGNHEELVQGEPVLTDPIPLGDGSVDAVVCAVAGVVDRQVEEITEFAVFRMPDGSAYKVTANYLSKDAVEPKLTATVDYARCAVARGVGAEIDCQWAAEDLPRVDALEALRRVPASARDMKLTEQDIYAGPIGLKLPEGFEVLETVADDSGVSRITIANQQTDLRMTLIHLMPSPRSTTPREFCENMLDAAVEGAKVVDRLPAFRLESTPDGYEEAKQAFGDMLEDFSVPAEVAVCAAHAELDRAPGVVQDITYRIWEAKGGERLAYRVVLPLEAYKADPGPFAHNYVMCSVSRHFGSITGCLA